MSLVAYRAGELLKPDQLKAHLSLLLRVENVGALFGSGTSISAGGKQMLEVINDFRSEYVGSYEFLLKKNLLSDEKGNLLNFEDLIGKISIAIEFHEKIEKNDLAKKQYADALKDLQKSVLKAAKLEDAFWSGNFEITSNGNSLEDYQTFLVRLCAARQPGQPLPWIFTLNYDLGVEWTAESLGIHINNGFKGVHFRKFDSSVFDVGYRNALSTGQAQYSIHGINYVKLHGSLSWKMDLMNEDLREMPSETHRGEIDTFIKDGKDDFPGFLIFPSAAKFQKTVGYVYGEMVRRFHEFATKEQTALIITGYSFSDLHINRILSSALENPTMQIIVFYTEFDGQQKSLSSAPLLELAHQRQLPNITIVGNSKAVFFNEVAKLLPIPAIIDQRKEDLKKIIRSLSQDTLPPTHNKSEDGLEEN